MGSHEYICTSYVAKQNVAWKQIATPTKSVVVMEQKKIVHIETVAVQPREKTVTCSHYGQHDIKQSWDNMNSTDIWRKSVLRTSIIRSLG
ncbi:hypothetical protein ACF0H5_004608 [Mactra antiquata]